MSECGRSRSRCADEHLRASSPASRSRSRATSSSRSSRPSRATSRALATVIHMRGGGQEGVGEDVTYDALDHVALQDAGPVQELAGSWTLGSFFDHVGALDLFPAEPVRDVSRLYRRWAFESAALDLALRQQGTPLAEALGRELRPVTFVVSLRLGEPPTLEPVRAPARSLPDAALQARPDPRVDRRADRAAGRDRRGRLGRPEGLLQGHGGRQPAGPRAVPAGGGGVPRRLDRGPRHHRRDPARCSSRTATASPGTRRSTRSPTSRRCPYPPKMVNVKPSRFGSVKALPDAYDYLAERGIGAYGGGQFELGPGPRPHPVPRVAVPPGHAQRRGARRLQPRGPARRACPSSPLEPRPSATGFRWE